MTLADQQGWRGRKQKVDVRGTDIAYVEVSGREPALLLIHGFTDTSRSFSLLAPHLAGRRLVIPDLPGHGASQARSELAPADLAEVVAGLVGKLQLDRPIVVGHSMGGMIAIELAARYPDAVGGIVLLATTLRADIRDEDAMAAGVLSLKDPISPTDPFFDFWHACEVAVAPDFLASTAAEASAMPAENWRAIFAEIRRADLTPSAHMVRARTLVITGGHDPLFDASHRDRLRGALPSATFVEAGLCGHNIHWEAPALVAQTIVAHFEVQASEPARSSV